MNLAAALDISQFVSWIPVGIVLLISYFIKTWFRDHRADVSNLYKKSQHNEDNIADTNKTLSRVEGRFDGFEDSMKSRLENAEKLHSTQLQTIKEELTYLRKQNEKVNDELLPLMRQLIHQNNETKN